MYYFELPLYRASTAGVDLTSTTSASVPAHLAQDDHLPVGNRRRSVVMDSDVADRNAMVMGTRMSNSSQPSIHRNDTEIFEEDSVAVSRVSNRPDAHSIATTSHLATFLEAISSG